MSETNVKYLKEELKSQWVFVHGEYMQAAGGIISRVGQHLSEQIAGTSKAPFGWKLAIV